MNEWMCIDLSWKIHGMVEKLFASISPNAFSSLFHRFSWFRFESALNNLSARSFLAADSGIVRPVVETEDVVFEFAEGCWELGKILFTFFTWLDSIAEVVSDCGVLLGFARIANGSDSRSSQGCVEELSEESSTNTENNTSKTTKSDSSSSGKCVVFFLKVISDVYNDKIDFKTTKRGENFVWTYVEYPSLRWRNTCRDLLSEHRKHRLLSSLLVSYS